MNRLNRLLTFAALSTAFACPALAQTTPAQPQQPGTTGTTTQAQQPGAAASAQADPAAKAAEYQAFRDVIQKDQAKAYELGQAYLAKYPADTDDIAQYIKKFVTTYAAALPKYNCTKLVGEKKWPEAFAACKQVAASQPDDLGTHINLAWAGLSASLAKNEQVMAEAPAYTLKAVQLINSGKTPEEGKPFANKDETLSWMNFALGYYNLKSNPKEAANYLHKSAQFEGSIKKDPQTYALLAQAYQTGEYNRLSAEYKVCCESKEETPESKAKLENIGQVLDRVIDSYARAIAYVDQSADKARYEAAKQQWMTDLTPLFKFRNNDSDAGLPALISGVLAKPMPTPEITPVAVPTTTTDPAATPGATGTTPTPTTGTTTGTTPSGTTTPGAATPGATTTRPTPSGTTTTTKPTPATPANPSTGTGTTTTAPKPTPKPTATTGGTATTPRP